MSGPAARGETSFLPETLRRSMRSALAIALLLALTGVAAVAIAPTASACVPYSVCAVQHDLRCAQATDDAVEKVECIDLM